MDYRGQHVTVMGLGHFGGGVAAARWLAANGAVVTVTDQACEAALADAISQLQHVPIAAVHLGEHREEDFHNAGLVVVNPAVKPTSPWLSFVRRLGATVRTELELFLENCKAPVIGVTGSNGKSTTASMIAAILEASGHRVFLGGNIGGSLLHRLPEITENDWVVLEISSFQLWHFSADVKMPHVAVVTGCSPNHLDWHPDFADYAAAKQRILRGQMSKDFAVLNTNNAEVAVWSQYVRGNVVALPSLNLLPTLPAPGRHNRQNAACAAAAAMAAGCTETQIAHGMEYWRPLPQRLEPVGVVRGRSFYNDSTATTPESTIAALESLAGPKWFLIGGKNKGFDFNPLAAAVRKHARGAAVFGTAREELHLRITTAHPDVACVAVPTMEEALQWCWNQSRPEDAIVLSPACASTDQFRNFRERGECFNQLVRRLHSAG